MYISKELTRLPLIEIGGLFGGRDHTTVIYAYEKITNSIKNNSEIKRVVENIITKIKTKN
jgi:chromosomal replication initiator protein